MIHLKTIEVPNLISTGPATLSLSYQTFGKALGEAPVVLVNHALTGNSNVSGEDGWWKDLIGKGKCIDTDYYTVLAFNIPGNGFDGNQFLIDDYTRVMADDIALIFAMGLRILKIKSVYAVIGGSVGGGLAWELAALEPELIEHLIPIASDWKATDWLIANCMLQDRILNNSKNPVEDARIHAMMCYRTPESFKAKFNRTLNGSLEIFNIESWLLHHGDKLKDRFQLSAYKLINQLLKSIDISREGQSFEKVAATIKSHVHLISIDTDLFFKPEENLATYNRLKKIGVKADYYQIESIHGHDAFLIEFEQLSEYLSPIFKKNRIKVA